MAQIVAQGYDALSHHRVLKLDNGQYITEYSTDLQNWSEGEPQERHEKRNATIVPTATPEQMVPIVSTPKTTVMRFTDAVPERLHWLIFAGAGVGTVAVPIIALMTYMLLHGGVH